MPGDARTIEASLLRKGFQRREGRDAYFHLYVGGRKTPVFTKMSQGAGEISDKLMGMMARQVRLTRRQFNDLIDCPLSFEQYVSLLRDAGYIAGPQA